MSSVIKVDAIQNQSGTSAMTIDSSGRVSLPALPAWRVQLNSTQNISSNSVVVAFDNSSVNGCFIQGGCSLSAGVITVPVAGLYQINASVRYQNTNGSYIELYMRVNASNTHRSYHIVGNADDTYHSLSMGHVFKLAANDTVDLLVNAQGDTSWLVQGGSLSTFSGIRLG